MAQFNKVVCGGTFDHFHKGHEHFLRFCLKSGNHLVVGLTSDKFGKSKSFSSTIQSYKIRKKSLENFLKKENAIKKTSLIKINDIFGPTLSPNFAADRIIVSKDTEKGAVLINKKRLEKGLLPIKILFAENTLADDKKPITSSRIRKGEISKQGRLFIKDKWFSETLYLPDNLRNTLQKPMGKIITQSYLEKVQKISSVTVGDIVTSNANSISLGQSLSVIDFLVQREKKFSNIEELGFSKNENVIKVRNPAGTLTPELFAVLKKIFSISPVKRSVIIIDGEEDLSVLPIILFSPLGTRIFYGQPNVGMVELVVSEILKTKIFSLLNKFQTRGY